MLHIARKKPPEHLCKFTLLRLKLPLKYYLPILCMNIVRGKLNELNQKIIQLAPWGTSQRFWGVGGAKLCCYLLVTQLLQGGWSQQGADYQDQLRACHPRLG